MRTYCSKVELALPQPCLIWLTPYVNSVNIAAAGAAMQSASRTIGPKTSPGHLRRARDRTRCRFS